MKPIITIVLVLLSIWHAMGQGRSAPLQGEITYATSKNIYVKFNTTSKINTGDTLYINTKPCLIVINKSSRSCICIKTGDCDLARGTQVVHRPSKKQASGTKQKSPKTHTKSAFDEPVITMKQVMEEHKEKISGFVSVSGYGLFNDKRNSRNRFTSRLSFNVRNIAGSKFSFSSYLSYKQNFIPGAEAVNRQTMFFNVYDLAIKFEASPGLKLLIGRKINPKMSSVGAIDGLQSEFTFGNSSIGLVAGTRPGIYDYNFDPILLQYGGYYSFATTARSFFSTTTLGYMEQKNNDAIDRRYLYFQHSSSIMRNLYLFTSFEADLYKTVNGIPESDFRMTNIYASLRYRFLRRVNVSLSYNNRRRTIYYETYHTEIEKLLNDDIARQGIRAGIRVKMLKNLTIGGSYSKRFQTDEQNKSDNIHADIYLYNFMEGRLKLSYNQNTSNYLKSQAASVFYSRMLNNWLSLDIYYRALEYFYFTREASLNGSKSFQHFTGADFSVFLPADITISLMAEYSHLIDENNYRFYLKLIKRFHTKKKK